MYTYINLGIGDEKKPINRLNRYIAQKFEKE
jgi:hypothetical protein